MNAKSLIASLAVSACLLASQAPLRAAQYSQDFANLAVGTTTNFGDGSALFSTHLGSVASVVDANLRELQLTANGTGNTRSAFLLPDLDPSSAVYAFSAKWNADIYGTFNGGADGFSFNFGQIGGVNLIGAGYAQEAGYSNGLSLSVQTFSGNNPGFYLRIHGRTVASAPYNPATQWGNLNNARHYFEMDWHYLKGITVRVDGQTIFTDVLTHGFVPQAGDRFAWAARTGGASEEVRLDNIFIMTGGTVQRVQATAPYFNEAGNIGVALAFDGVAQPTSAWQDFTPPNALIGATVPPTRVVAYALSSSSTFNSTPTTFALYAGNGNLVTLCANVNNAPVVGAGETRCWPANTPGSFTSYGLTVGANAGNGSVISLSELTFYEFVSVTNEYDWHANAVDPYPWSGLALSANGSRQYLATGFGAQTEDQGVYENSYSGQPSTWNQTAAPASDGWGALACSADGARIFAVNAGRIWSSGNGGDNWGQTAAPFASFGYRAVACTPDGTKVIAAAGGSSGISMSLNSGGAWFNTGAPVGSWRSLGISSNGLTLIGGSAGSAFVSTNGGTNWATAPLTSDGWNSVAVSADGKRMVAAGQQNGVWVSSDAGATWTKTPLLTGPFGAHWSSVAMSADGIKLIVSDDNGFVFTSTDAGTTWVQTPAPSRHWKYVACSADGTTMVAVANEGDVWRYVLLPTTPVLRYATPSIDNGGRIYLQGVVTPMGARTVGWMVWGTNLNYGNTNVLDFGNSTLLSVLEARSTPALSNLAYGVTVHYRFFVSNAVSSSVQSTPDATFVTPGSAPTVTMAPPWISGLTTATLSGTVDANYITTAAWFEWGTTTSYGNMTAMRSITNFPGAQSMVADLTNLTSGALYHCRIVATNLLGVSYGNDFSFIMPSTNTVVDLSLRGDQITADGAPSIVSAIDNSAETKFYGMAQSGTARITPSLNSRPVRALTLISSDDAPDADPSSFLIEGSVDGSSFTRIASNAVPPFVARHSIQSFSFANDIAYNFYRVSIPTVRGPGNAGLSIAEAELLAFPEITSSNDTVSITLPEGAADVNGVSKLFNRQLDGSEKLEVAPLAGGNTIVDITLAAGAQVLKGFQTIGAADDASYPDRVPSSITIAGSNDGTNYTTLAVRFPETTVANLQLRDFGLNTNTLAFAKYRITFGAPIGGDRIQVGELRLFGEAPAASAPTLSIRASGGNVIVSWPHATGFNLESKTNLNQLNWNAVTNAPALSNGLNIVTLPNSGGSRFFQLRK